MKTKIILRTFSARTLLYAAWLFGAATLSSASITFTNDTTINSDNTNYEGAEIAVTNCTLTINGPHSFGSVHILNGGKLTHSGAANGAYQPTFNITNEQQVFAGTTPITLAVSNVVQPTIIVQDLAGAITYTNGADYLVNVDSNALTTIQRTEPSFIPDGSTNNISYQALGPSVITGLNLNVTNDIVIATGGAIIADGLGYGLTYGPGRGGTAGSPASGAGGGHGGYGGLSASNAFGGTVYDSITQPSDKGSGGGSSYDGSGGYGGGAIRLVAGGLVQIDGVISAKGANGVNQRSGGGSGGSIWISAQTIAGAGSVIGDGGAGEPIQGGGGGAGRIALYFDTNVFSGLLSARGGSGAMAGGAGTIYTKPGSQSFGDLLVDNNGRRGTNTLLTATERFSVSIKSGAIVSLSGTPTIGNLIVSSNGWISAVNNGLSVVGNATVEPGGVISAEGTGYGSGVGPGFGRTTSGTNSGGGAGYGGLGASSLIGGGGGTSYGSTIQPVDVGSGGGAGVGVPPYNAGGSGGGSIRLTVTGTLALSGKISADGKAGFAEGSGGGAGGSIWLTVGQWMGAGVVSANGGAGNGLGGGGGGGRIAVYYQSNNFTGTVFALGGSNSGGAGTIYSRRDNMPYGDLLVDNGGRTATNTPIPTVEYFNLTARGGAVLAIPGNATFSSLMLGSNSWMLTTNSFVIVSGNATIQSGAGILANGTGFPGGSGNGFGRNFLYYPPIGGSPFYIGGGAGHGGLGAGTVLGGGGPTNDSSSNPNLMGSGGGMGSDSFPTNAGGAGGGIIRLTVSGALQLDGKLSADGITPANHNSGGGAGGSMILSVGTLSGSGLISANGGAGTGLGGGGGGGRIAISYQTNLFAGLVRAWGGGTTTNIGGAGTIYSKAISKSIAQMFVDNGGRSGTNTDLGIPGTSPIDLSVTGGAVAGSLYTSLNTLFIGSNGWVWPPSTAITVLSNATIQNGGGLIADGLGFTGGIGVGRNATTTLTGGGGGGYGGFGGAGFGTSGAGSTSGFGGVGYGSFSVVSSLQSGSSGGNAYSTNSGGIGGGVIRLTVNGTLTHNGKISANGLPGTGANCGGGSGGGIAITAGTLLGSGTLSANGGAGLSAGGGGGGGRIILLPASNQLTGVISALGGNGYNRGGAGTIYTKIGQSVGLVLVDNGGFVATNTLVADSGSFDLTVGGGGIALHSSSFVPRNLLVLPNGWVSITNQATLNISSNATIQAGGGIIADRVAGGGQGNGYYAFNGPRGGGGYGGAGGANIPNYGRTYGSLTTPTDLGSGGANGSGSSFAPFGGAGGGALRVNVTGALAIDGRISANGGNGDTNSGGGSGGSVWLSAGTLLGSGQIAADGGAGDGSGGGGGGGRISISYNTNLFTGTISAFGGAGFARGGAGTIYFKPNIPQGSVGTVTVDNGGGAVGTNTGLGAYSGTIDLNLKDGAVLPFNSYFSVRNLIIGSNAWVTFSNQNSVATMTGNVTIQAGGGFIADGAGYSGGQGSGFGGSISSSTYGTTGGGGGHGGYGAASIAGGAGGNSYDQPSSPATGGSGGGTGANGFPNSFGGAGGGVVNVNIPGTLLLQGKISANGLPGNGQGSGGGAGGSILLSVGTLSGSGTISANGGPGNGLGGGGGGGRIAISFTSNNFSGAWSAFGGGGYAWGGAGTIYTRRSSEPVGWIIVDNGGHVGTNTPLAASATGNLAISNGAIVHPSSGYLVLSNLMIGPGGLFTSLKAQTNIELAILGDALVDAGGLISLDAKGYAQGSGPGAGLTASAIGSGAGYGGAGGASSLSPGGASYGSAQQPVDRGSGGGFGYGAPVGGSEGGGALRLTVARTLTVIGRLGSDGNAAYQDDAGAGSGGSLWITANTINGAGQLTALGGPAEIYAAGGGGGGRIAIYSRTNDFTGAVSAAGGDGYSSGQDGSIFLGTNADSPAVIAQTPTGIVSNGVNIVDLSFNTALSFSSLTAADILLTTPNGSLAESNISITMLSPSRVRVGFPFQTAPGTYTIAVGPGIEDLFAQPMSQVYTGAFTISVPVIQGTVTNASGQPVAGVLMQPSAGSAGITDANGNYLIGVSPGDTITVTPVLDGLMFVPFSRHYFIVTNSISNENYLAVTTIAPVLNTQIQGTNLVLNWTGISGVSYLAFYSTNLLQWFPYNEIIAGTNGPMQQLVPIDSDPSKFFRVQASN